MAVVIVGIGGIGGVLARKLVARGAAVHLIARSAEKLAALERDLTSSGAASSTLVRSTVADVLDPTSFAASITGAATTWGGLRGLAYAVGSIPLKPLRSTTDVDFEQAWRLNFLGAAIALRAAAPALAAAPDGVPGGVVFFSSIAAGLGFPNHTAIAAAKGAIESLTRSAGAELAPRVRVNCIAPSLSATPLASRMTGEAVPEAVRKGLADAHPLGRLGTAGDSAALADFLLDGERSGWVSGQVWAVDGGRSSLRPRN